VTATLSPAQADLVAVREKADYRLYARVHLEATVDGYLLRCVMRHTGRRQGEWRIARGDLPRALHDLNRALDYVPDDGRCRVLLHADDGTIVGDCVHFARPSDKEAA
jgi:Flp pilus assembly protein TadD